jgi:hypothetical protein
VEDLIELFEAGRALGEKFMADLVRLLPQGPTSYGKGAIVGLNGEFEHGGACIHPMLGKPMRAAVGGGKAVIPANVKVAASGVSLDVPLTHKRRFLGVRLFRYNNGVDAGCAKAGRDRGGDGGGRRRPAASALRASSAIGSGPKMQP